MFVDDDELIRDFHMKSGHCLSSIKSYRTVFNKYRSFHDMSMCDLLAEAISEQESKVPENQLSVYDRILSFRNHLIKNHVGNTINNSVSKIKTFYRYNRIHLPFIPPMNAKRIKKNDVISFKDLPTREELKRSLDVSGDELALWIFVLLSSGMTRVEAKSMTNRTLFEGTRTYHKKDNFKDALKYLSAKDNVVCTCPLIRQKTDKPYYAFLTPECVQKIAEVKLKSRDYDMSNPLLKYSLNYVNYRFKVLNDVLGFGRAGGYSKLRPHMLRKFNASYLNQNSAGKHLSMDDIDCLQGRGKNRTRQSYFKENPEYLKLKYVSVMNNVSIYHKYTWKIKDGELKISARRL